MPDIRHDGSSARRTSATRTRAPIPDPARAFAEPSPRTRAEPPPLARPRPAPHGLAGQIAMAAELLPDLDDPAFGRLFDRFGEARVLLLGVAGDGAAEFCRARAAITRWLIEHRGFNMVALEADSVEARVLDARVRGRRPADRQTVGAHGPWRNAEFDAFLDWLAEHNRGRSPTGQTGVYGLDLYNTSAARTSVADHLDRGDPQAALVARERYAGMTPWSAPEPLAHSRAALAGYMNSEAAATSRLVDLLARQVREAAGSDEALLRPERGARLLHDAQAHYSALHDGGAAAWNARAAHMFDTLKTLLDAHGCDAKVVVWAHNAQAGDARATDLARLYGEHSLGQLCRTAWPDQTRLIGFGAHGGTLAPGGVEAVSAPAAESVEALSHDAAIDRFLLDLRPSVNRDLRRALSGARPERFVAEETARVGQSIDCRLPEQFDAWVWFDQVTATTPSTDATTGARGADTWPPGL